MVFIRTTSDSPRLVCDTIRWETHLCWETDVCGETHVCGETYACGTHICDHKSQQLKGREADEDREVGGFCGFHSSGERVIAFCVRHKRVGDTCVRGDICVCGGGTFIITRIHN